MIWLRKNKNSDLELEEYVEDDYNYYDGLDNTSYDYDADDYEKFNQIDNDYDATYDVEDDDSDNNNNDSYNNSHDNSNFISILSIFSTWFTRIGVVIAIILIAFFIVKGQFNNLLLYIIGLIASFFFGYFFMFILVKYGDKR